MWAGSFNRCFSHGVPNLIHSFVSSPSVSFRPSIVRGTSPCLCHLTRAKKLQEKNAFGPSSADIQEVLNAAYRDLRNVQAKSAIDYLNIEELFSAIDMGAMLGIFGSPGLTPRSTNCAAPFVCLFTALLKKRCGIMGGVGQRDSRT